MSAPLFAASANPFSMALWNSGGMALPTSLFSNTKGTGESSGSGSIQPEETSGVVGWREWVPRLVWWCECMPETVCVDREAAGERVIERLDPA